MVRQCLKGHRGEVIQLDWSTDSRYIRSVSSLYELFFWDVDAGVRVKFISLLRDVTWLTDTCALGWTTMGIWPTEIEGSEVFSVAVNQQLHNSSTTALYPD